jgi:hypothetical protein
MERVVDRERTDLHSEDPRGNIGSLGVLLWMLQHCPSWSSDEIPTSLQIEKVVRAVGRLPLAPLAGAFRNNDADQRITAAVILGNNLDLIAESEKGAVLETLVAALADPNVRVREFVARPLRTLHSVDGDAALARSLNGPNVTAMYFGVATGRNRTLAGATSDEPNASTFPAATVILVGTIFPNFLSTLRTREESGVRQLLAAIERNGDPGTTPVLVWLLVNGDIRAYGGLVTNRLVEQQRAERLPFGELATVLIKSDPDHRLAVADLFARLLQLPPARTSSGNRERMIAALIESLGDADIDVRTRAAEALGSARAASAVRPLTSALDGRDVTQYYASTIIRALVLIGSREALPTLERWARSAGAQRIRVDAASAFIAIAKGADPASETRRLLWEVPDTAFERAVLARGTTALPLAWQALATGSVGERRAAAALLGSFADTRSIRPIIAALANAPGALTTNQLLFDLNIILLTEGFQVDGEQRNALAAQHLQWLYDQLANQPIDTDIRSTVLAQKTIAVFPDRIAAPFSVELATQAAGVSAGQPRREFSATALRFESPEAFLESVAKNGCGVAFHAITAAEGIARVATTLYLPRGRIANQVWIALYRNEGGRWVPLQVPSHPVLHRMQNEPNLLPTINRNYGLLDPLKLLRLDLTMERIRVDLKANHYLQIENLDNPRTDGRLDASYVRLLERYKRSDAPSVRYTAEFESERLTGEPDIQLWIDALAQQTGSPFQEMAQQVLASYTLPKFKAAGMELAGAERAQLIAAALTPEANDPRLLPQRLPQSERIVNAQRWGRFGMVAAVFGSGPLGMSGYSMLFDRRDGRWIFLCIVTSWIS